MAVQTKVNTMLARGKHGYIARVENGERIFLKESDRTRQGSSLAQLIFNLTEDGIYEIQDANFGSSRLNRYYLKIENGDVVDQQEYLNDLIIENEKDLNLPKLEGSQKQIDWAENIRSKYGAKILTAGKEVHPRILKETSAKFYIDNREKMK